MKTDISTTDQLDFLKKRLNKGVRVSLTDVISRFWRASLYNSLISNEKYLELIASFIEETNPSVFVRLDFYKYLETKLVKNSSTQIKLQELAFVMELMQTNSLSQHDALRILTQAELTKLERADILILKEDRVTFYHSTIHSYYSASFLCTNNDLISFFGGVIAAEKNAAPIPNVWYEVISFCLEMFESADFALWLVESMKKHAVLVDEGMLNAIEQGYIDKKLPPKSKRLLFRTIYKQYSEKQIWLPDSAEVLLARIASKSEVEVLRKALDTDYKTETEMYVNKANAIGIIDEILKLNSTLLEPDDWHGLLIDYANDLSANGVLQRRSLKALGHYKRPSDIKLLQKAYEHPDRLVHEAFLIFCFTVAPNNKQTIQYLADGLLKECEIYARYGFYAITSRIGIQNFLSILSGKVKYISKFMDGESIFNDKDRHEDDKLLDLIRKFLSPQIIKRVKALILVAYSADAGYHAERSYFIGELTTIVSNHDNNFALEIANQVNNEDRIYQISALIAHCVTIDNYVEVLDVLTRRHEKFVPENFVYVLSNEGREDIYLDAVRRGIVQEKPVKAPRESSDDYEAKRKQMIYEDFKHSLEPEKDKYLTNVFKLFIQNQEVIEEIAASNVLDRFKHLTKNIVLDGFDPADIKVRINNRETNGSNTNYTITSYAGYYGDVVMVAVQLFGANFVKQNYRAKLISYLPYAFYEDRKAIIDLVDALSPEELAALNAKYANKKNDTRYFMTDSYFYILQNQLDKGLICYGSVPVLKSLIEDSKIRLHEREESLDIYGKIVQPSEANEARYLKRLFNRYKNEKGFEVLADKANKILIAVFKVRSAAIWRFDEIENRAAPFVMQSGFHSVGTLENELHDKPFGKPLTSLDKTYVGRFLKLLDSSIEILSNDKDRYMNYASYIWSLSYEYFENLGKDGDIEPLKKLERWYKNRAKAVEGANWFEHRLEQLRKSYAAELSRVGDFESALQELERLKLNG